MERGVFYLSAHETCGWRSEGYGLVAGDPAPGATVLAVVDFADEACVLARLPAMRGRDAALLRRRRLEREFPGVSLAALQVLRRHRHGSNADVVMVAVPGGQVLQEALDGLAGDFAVRAVTTPALLGGEWLRRAGLRDRRVLIVLPTPAGVRLMFFDGGWPKLSRLTASLDPSVTAVEIARTVQYLQNTQRVERGEAIELWFWGIDDAHAVACLPTGVDIVPGASPRVPSLPDPEADGLDALLAFGLAHPGRFQLAPDEVRIGWLAREFERGCRIAAAATIATALVATGALAWRTQRDARASAHVITQRNTIEHEMTRLGAELSSRGVTLAEVSTVPEARQALGESSLDAAAALSVVGAGLGVQPDVVIESVELRAGTLPVSAVASAERAAENVPIADSTGAGPIDGATACGGGAEPSILVEFGLAEGIDVRRRDAALGWVREATSGLDPWRAGPAATAIGRRDALVVTADRTEARTGSRWSICLQREATT